MILAIIQEEANPRFINFPLVTTIKKLINNIKIYNVLLEMIDQEVPSYVLHKSKSRSLIPKMLGFLVLGALFYAGILLNISLLELRNEEESIIILISMLILFLVISVGVYLAIRRANLPYLFYRDRIMFNGNAILYAGITNTQPHQNLWDKMFKTESINLGNDLSIKHIPQTMQIQNYLQQLVQYGRGMR